jgi:hypothetical protein
VSLASVARYVIAAALTVQAFGPEVREAAAGTAVASFQVTARLAPDTAGGCRAAGDPVTLACIAPGASRTLTVLQSRPDLSGMAPVDGWLTYGHRTEVYDSVYAASLTTRVIRYEQWEYIETLVSW